MRAPESECCGLAGCWCWCGCGCGVVQTRRRMRCGECDCSRSENGGRRGSQAKVRSSKPKREEGRKENVEEAS
jgi:hypothetical protein